MNYKGKFMKLEERQEHFIKFLEESGYIEAPLNKTKGYEYHFKMKGGFDLQAVCRMKITKTVTKSVKTDCPVVPNIPAVVDSRINHNALRIEFNPNNVHWPTFTAFWRLFCAEFPWVSPDDVKFNRLDIACDYHIKIDPFLFWNRAKKYVIFGDYDRGTETHYMGAMGSEKMIRVYDKKRERRVKTGQCNIKGHWWRLEVVFAPHQGVMLNEGINIPNPFLDLNYIHQDDIDYDAIKSDSHKAWVRAILRVARDSSINESINFLFQDSHRNERKRKKTMMSELETKKPFQMPQELFDIYWVDTWNKFEEKFLNLWEEPNHHIRQRYLNWFDVYTIVPNDDYQDFK